MIRGMVGFAGKLTFNATKLDGAWRKVVGVCHV